MHLGQYLDTAAVSVRTNVGNVQELLDLLVEMAMKTTIMREHPHHIAEKLRIQLLEEEHTGKLVEDCGLILPHLRLEDFTGLGLSFVTLDKAIPAEGAHALPIKAGCLMLLPAEHPTIGLKVMSQLARLMLHPEDCVRFLNAATSQECLAVLETYFKIDDVITARDIMRKPKYSIYVDTPLRHVTRKIVFHGVEAIGVVDYEHRIVGQITCDDLFRFGLPEYFGQLKTVSFIRKFDPFERYFSGENSALAKDVMTSNFSVVEEDTTLLEIVFELAVKKRPKVFVAKDGLLVGIIDRQLVLDRVINF